jgi:hypothetical protein
MTQNPAAGDPADGPLPIDYLADTASWVSKAVARARQEAAPTSGIIAPLEFTAQFAANSQPDAVSVSMANGRVSIAPWALDDSGLVTISLRWSAGFRLTGLPLGREVDGWTVTSVTPSRVDLDHPSLRRGEPAVTVPTVTLVKPGAPDELDEFTARLSGTSEYCRDKTVRGWSRS